MAIWQFAVQLVPRKWVLENPIGVDQFLLEEGFSCAIAWEGSPQSIDSLVLEIDKGFPRGRGWSESCLLWGEVDSTDIQLWSEGSEIDSLQARIDLRSDPFNSIRLVCQIAQSTQCMIYSPELHEVFDPSLEGFLGRIRNSRSWSFVSDPRGFLERLSNEPKR